MNKFLLCATLGLVLAATEISAKTDCKDISGHRNCNRKDECQWARKNIDSKSKSCIDYVEVSVTDVNTTVTDVDATATNATNATEDPPANVQTAEQTETRTETNPRNTVETFFPLTYVISLQARETYMHETMDYFGVEHPTFLKAMPKQHTTSFRAKLEQDARPVKDRALGRAMNDGELACTISHMSALANFLNSSKDSVLIFEDDIKQEGNASVPSKFTTTMQNVPEDWEFINFGRCWDQCENDVKVAPGVIVPTRPMCSHAYSVSRPGAEKIMKACGSPISLEHTYDTCIAHLVETKSLVSYAPSKALWWQDRNKFSSELGSEGMYQECDWVSEKSESRQRRGSSGGITPAPQTAADEDDDFVAAVAAAVAAAAAAAAACDEDDDAECSGGACFGGNTTYKGQRYMQSGDEEFGEGNTTCFTRKYTVAPGSSKTTPFIPIPEAEVDRICVTREHAACVVSKQGEHVSLPVAYLKEGLVLCDQSVVSDLAVEQHSRLLFIAKKPHHPINNILSQFGASVDSIEISEEQLAHDELSSLVAPGKPYADIMLMERIPQYYMSTNISANECLKVILGVHSAARACQTFSCIAEIFESEKGFPAKLDPELKSWLINYISKTYIPKLASTCFPTSLNDLYNTLTDPEGTCIKKLRFDDGAPAAVLKSLRGVSPSFVCQNTLDSKECRESMRGCCRAVDGKKRYNPTVADTQTFLDSTSIAEAATTCSATCATDVACTAVEVSKRGKKHPARCEFFTNTEISSSDRASKSCKKAECIVKKDYAAPVAEPTPSGQPVPLIPETSAPTATPTTLPVWNELRGCCREVTGKKKFSHHNTATIVKLAESSATAAAAACKQQCSDDSTCTAAEFSTKNKPKKNKKNKKSKNNKKNKAAVYMCERHTATINSATRATRSCKKATCSIKA